MDIQNEMLPMWLRNTLLRRFLAFLMIILWAVITTVEGLIGGAIGGISQLVRPGQVNWLWNIPMFWTNTLEPLCWTLDIKDKVDSSQVTHAALQGPTIGAVTHPSSIGVIRFAKGWWPVFKGPHKAPIKEELKWYPFGIGLWLTGVSMLLPRGDRAVSMELLKKKMTIRRGTAIILVDGTRPRMTHEFGWFARWWAELRGKTLYPKNTITRAREKLREMGLSEIADDYMGGLWRDTGITTMLRANPDAFFCIQISFGSVHEEGFAGAEAMIGGTFYQKVVEIDRALMPFEDEVQRRLFWNYLGAAVWRYVADVRAGKYNIDEEFVFEWEGRQVTMPKQA